MNLLRVAYILDALVQVHIRLFREIPRTDYGGDRRVLKGYTVRQNTTYYTIRDLVHYRDEIENVVENGLLKGLLPNEVGQVYTG